MKKKNPRWGVGPKFAVISIIYGVIIFGSDILFFHTNIYEIVPFSIHLKLVIVGVVFILTGGIILFTAVRKIGKCLTEGILCRYGVYSFTRHPIYAAWILFIIPGTVIITGYLLGFSIPVFMYLLFKTLISEEERCLKTEFREKYLYYKKDVPQLFPRVTTLVQELFIRFTSSKPFTGGWSPLDTGKITPNIWAVRDKGANIFIYSDGEDTICIDAGYRYTDIENEFNKIGIDPDSITHLFLTHGDPDHAGGVDFFCESDRFKNAEIFVGKEEKSLLEKKERRLHFFYNYGSIFRDYTLLEDGDAVEIGKIKVEAVATPGHTTGHMSYLVDGKYLFCGDAVSLKKGKTEKKAWINNRFNMDAEAQKKSLDKLSELDGVRFLFTSHTGYTSYKYQIFRR